MDVREKYVMQKINRKEKSICPNCIHHNLCIAENNQPCFECNRFIDANGVTVQECGHWISLTDCANAGVYCSICNKKVYKEDYAWCNRKNKLRSDYCPHCGAKMLPKQPKGE